MLRHLYAVQLETSGNLDVAAPSIDPEVVHLSPAIRPFSDLRTFSYLAGSLRSIWDASGAQIIRATILNQTSAVSSRSFMVSREGEFAFPIEAGTGDPIGVIATDDYGNRAIATVGLVPPGGPDPLVPEVDLRNIVATFFSLEGPSLESHVTILVFPGAFKDDVLPLEIELTNQSTGFSVSTTVYSLMSGTIAEVPGDDQDHYSITVRNVFGQATQEAVAFQDSRTQSFEDMVLGKLAALFSGSNSLLQGEGGIRLRSPSEAAKKDLADKLKDIARQMSMHPDRSDYLSGSGYRFTSDRGPVVTIVTGFNGEPGGEGSLDGKDGKSVGANDDRPGALVIAIGGDGGNGKSNSSGDGGDGGDANATASGSGGMAIAIGGGGGTGATGGGNAGNGGSGGKSKSTTTGPNSSSVSHAGNGGNAAPQGTGNNSQRGGKPPREAQGLGGNGGDADASSTGSNSPARANGGKGGDGAAGNGSNSDGGAGGNGGGAHVAGSTNDSAANGGSGGNGGAGQPTDSDGGKKGGFGKASSDPVGPGTQNISQNGSNGTAGMSFSGGHPTYRVGD